MAFSTRLSVFLYISWWALSSWARTNITIDETSSLISYVPASSWGQVTGDLDAGGGHMLTEDPNAYALITYTFVSYWILSAKWPYHVTTQHTLDNSTTIIIDLQDHSVPDAGGGGGSEASAIVARYIGTTSKTHTIRVSVAPGDSFAVLDRLIFEVEDTPTSTSRTTMVQTVVTSNSRSTISNTPTAAVAASSGSSHTARNLSIALGIVGPLLAVLIVCLIWWCCARRRKANRNQVYVASTAPIYDAEKSKYNGATESSPALRHAASYGDASDGPGGYAGLPGPYVPYVPSRDGSSFTSAGIAGVGASSMTQNRPPYPEIYDVPDPALMTYRFAQANGNGLQGTRSNPAHNLDGSDNPSRGSWAPSASEYSSNAGRR